MGDLDKSVRQGHAGNLAGPRILDGNLVTFQNAFDTCGTRGDMSCQEPDCLFFIHLLGGPMPGTETSRRTQPRRFLMIRAPGIAFPMTICSLGPKISPCVC